MYFQETSKSIVTAAKVSTACTNLPATAAANAKLLNSNFYFILLAIFTFKLSNCIQHLKHIDKTNYTFICKFGSFNFNN